MVKKLLTLFLGLTLAFNASASISFSESDVQFWVGTGSNSAVVIIGWDDDNPGGNFALAWGVHWNGSTTALALVDSIATYDSRLTYSFSGSMMQDILYNDGELIGASSYGWCYTLNGSWAPNAYNNQPVADGDLMEISASCMFSLTTAMAASNPNVVFSCAKPQAIVLTGLTANTVTVNIIDTTNVNNYTVNLYENDSLIDSIVIYTQTISYTTLTDNTGYTVKVFSNCSDGTQTDSRNLNFRTPCLAVAHNDLPWTEDFQSGTGSSYSTSAAFFSNHVFCWDLINPYSSSDPYINSSSSVNVSGGQCLYVSSHPSNPTILVLPPFEDAPNQLRLQFDVLSSYGHGFEAGVISDVTDETSFTPIAACLPTGSGWNHFEVTFAGVTTGRIALRSNDNGPAYLDNVTVDELPTCVKPSQVIVSNVDASSADITITDPNNTNHYMVYATEDDSVEIFSNTYTLTNLSPNTLYHVGVRTVCTDGLTNATVAAFRTGCGPIAIPYHEDFSQFVDVANGYGYAVTDSTLPCWGFFKAHSLDRLELFPPSQGSSYGYGNDGYTLRIYGNYSNSQDILMLPELSQAINTLEISFMTRPSETGIFGGILEVGYMTDPTDTTSFVTVTSNPCGQFTNGYDLRTATFTNAPANARIALRVVPTGGSAKSWYIDDLDVHDMPACARALGISVDNNTTDGFTLHVDDPTLVNNYRYYLTSEDGVDSADFYDTVLVITGLAASTDYELSVVSICNDGTLTLPHTISVSTLCAPVSEVPFVENFDTWTATQSEGMNRCWNRLYSNSSNNLVTNNYPYCATGAANAITGFKSLKMYSKGTSNDIKEYSVAYLPEFQANVTDLKVRFFYKYGGSTININKVRVAVGISEDVTDTTTFTRLATFVPTEIGWNEFEVEFSGYTGIGNRITIMQTSTGTTAITSYIDSLVVDTISSCNRPTAFEVSGITANSATLTWTDPSNAGSYIIRWNDGATTNSVIVANDTTYELYGLTPSTNYSVDIRSICWGEPTNARTLSFATSCAPMPLPWSMDFDNITNMNQLSSCWNRYSGLYNDSTHSATLTTTTSGWTLSTTAFDGSSHVKVNLYSTTCKYWLVTPEIDLTENAELTFDYMLTAYNNTNAPNTGTGFEDDRFIVLATTDNGTSWTPVAQWGSDTVNRDDYYLPSVTNTPSQATVSLSNFTGQIVRLAFYGESTVGGTDNDFRLDNIVVAVATDTTITPPDTTVTPIDTTELPVEAIIDFNDILFWVGTGANEAVMAVNWADTALAWGYRWNGTATVADMMADIAAADPRFSYVAAGMINDINYIDTAAGMTTPLGITPGNWWESSNNGVTDAGMGQTLANGDLEKWADPAAGVPVDSMYYDGYGWFYTNVYPMTIYPVTVPDTTTITPIDTTETIVDATIDPSEILYWVGTGNTEVIFVGNWCSPDVALAWGVRFNENSTTVEAVMDTIAAYDSRFGYSGSYSIINDVTYNDDNYSLTMLQPTTGYIMYNVNGVLADYGYSDMYVQQGDLIKVGNTDCAISTGDPADWTTWGYAWQTTIVPVSVPVTPPDTTEIPEEATIDFNDILFWVGTGANEAVMAVNWADTALAWGYRWNGTATVADMMADIAAADPRFSYVGEGFITDINYIDTAAGMTTPLGITPGYYWSSTNNGVMDMGMSQPLSNGDFEKWADGSTGILVDSVWVDDWGGYWNYIYVYPMTITPVTVPDTVHDGVNNYEMTQVFAYPNPCTSTLYIINEHADRIELYNMNGKLLEAIENRDTQVILNMQQYPAGMYLLKVGNGVQKILKK